MGKKKFRVPKYLFIASMVIIVLLIVWAFLFPDVEYIQHGPGNEYVSWELHIHYSNFILGIGPIISLVGFLLMLVKEKKVLSFNTLGIILAFTFMGIWTNDLWDIYSKTGPGTENSKIFYGNILIGLLWFGLVFDRIRYISMINKGKVDKVVDQLFIKNKRDFR